MLSLLVGLGTPLPIEQSVIDSITKEPPAIVQTIAPVELTLQQKIDTNFFKCNEAVEYIRADNAQCLAKPTYRAVSGQITVRAPQSGSNDMYWGFCTWHVKNLRPDLPSGLGNANTWYARAQAWGLPVGSTPRVGAVATTTRGSEGHVSLVLQVSGSRILVSEMNVQGLGVVSTAWYPASDYLYVY